MTQRLRPIIRQNFRPVANQAGAAFEKTYRVTGIDGTGGRDVRASHVSLKMAKSTQVAMFCEGRFVAVLIQDEK
jgi:hypothetical protein